MSRNDLILPKSVPLHLVADVLRVEAEVSQAEGVLALLEGVLKKVDAGIGHLRAKALDAGIPISIPPLPLAPAGAAAGQPPQLTAPLAAHPSEEKPLPRIMKVAEYAAYRHSCKRTIETKIRQGMPIQGRGHDRRVNREAADAWFRDQGDDGIKALARRNAALKAAKDGQSP